MHRFCFTDYNGLLEDLNKNEITQYGLRGRIFWDTGQIEWRKTDKGTVTFLALLENDSAPFPKKLQLTQEASPDVDGVPEDTTMVLWGTYNNTVSEYLEKRVSGSQPIPYPPSLKNGKTYPVLWVRIYKNKEGVPVFWRFTKPDAMNAEDWKQEE